MTSFGPDEDLVRRLSDLLKDTGLSEIEYEADGQRIRVARSLTAGALPVAALESAAGRPAERVNGGSPPEEAVPKGAVVAPMVGTAYLAPEPGAAQFVALGDRVEEGQSLLIIEAMKVMNQIPSPRAGRVTRILVEDGHPVEFGEPLMVIE